MTKKLFSQFKFGATAMAVIILSGAVAAALIQQSPAYATTGTLTITQNTTLTEDHNGNIVIAADNIRLNCDGHTVTDPGSGTGIELFGRTGVTVKNCFVTNFFLGIHLTLSDGNTIQKNTAFGNEFGSGGSGIILSTSHGNIIDENTAFGNNLDGFNIDQSNGNSFSDNTANDNGAAGFYLHDISHNTLKKNTADANGLYGFISDAIFNNTFDKNTANENGRDGFGSGGALENNFTHNTAERNSLDGFRFENSDRNSLEKNRADNNDNIGFSFTLGSDDNIVRKNKACDNGVVDASRDGTGVGNVFDRNHFCTTSGIP